VAKHQRSSDGRLRDFAQGLRRLRRRAGNPSYQALAEETGYTSADLAAAASGRALPPLTVTLAYVSACGGDAGAWADRWQALAVRWPGPDPLPPEDLRRRRPPIRRRGRRTILILASLLAIALAAAFLVDRSPMSQDTPAHAAAPAPEFKATVGPGCPVDFTRQVRMTGNWRDGDGDRCEDTFLFAPGTPENTFQWQFVLGGLWTRRCQIEVFIPDSPNSAGVARYQVADRFENVEQSVDQFTIDQKTNRGAWLPGSTVVVSTAVLLVRLSGDDGGFVAAGAVRLTCSLS
jgi:hypothetical protein